MTALRTVMAVLAVVFGGVALAWLVAFVRRWREAARFAAQQAFAAELLDAQAVKAADDTWHLEVRYAWTQDGARREGQALEHALSLAMDEETAQAHVTQLRRSQALAVRVGPAGDARLDSGLIPPPWVLLLMAAVFAVLAAAFGIAAALLRAPG